VKPTAEMDTIFANVTMLPTVLGFEPLMTLYWTLETELIFYFAAATVYRMGYLFQLKALFAGICLLICIFAAMIFGVVPAPHLMSWQSLPLNLAFMFWGTSFYAVFAKQNMPLDQPYRKYFLLLSAAAILSPSIYTLGRYFFTHSPDDFRWAVSYPSAFFIFLLTFFVNSRFTRIFASLGLISYSMYLLHPTAISIFSLVLERFPLNGSMSSLSVLTALSIAFTIVLSTSSYLFLEKPFIELGQKLTKKRSHVFNI
jgi:peptidoglycan/LPS O-acetylase OafA/YrhL